MLLLTPSRTCLDAAASLPPLWASNDSVLHLLLCEGLCISSFDSLYYATPDLFSFSICPRQWWLSLLDLLCSEVLADFPSLRFMIEILILILIIILIYFSLAFSCLFRLNLIIFDYQSVIFVWVWESVRFWFDLSDIRTWEFEDRHVVRLLINSKSDFIFKLNLRW